MIIIIIIKKTYLTEARSGFINARIPVWVRKNRTRFKRMKKKKERKKKEKIIIIVKIAYYNNRGDDGDHTLLNNLNGPVASRRNPRRV